jgi:uncharacterized membrane protein
MATRLAAGVVAGSRQASATGQPGTSQAHRRARRGRAEPSADRITAVSGSMLFVCIHIVWFGCWIGFGVEKYPYGLLTMIV